MSTVGIRSKSFRALSSFSSSFLSSWLFWLPFMPGRFSRSTSPQSNDWQSNKDQLHGLVLAGLLLPWFAIGCSAQTPPVSEQSITESRTAGSAAIKLATDFQRLSAADR